ncbi:hypothetical protein SDC9_136686 [bioreactor metagenome]|uniref:Uncharacterized protein n=1 Tax=bioreactor metagenome TaxID=1076179 RepID=A0A645DJU2_9ZZZZ
MEEHLAPRGGLQKVDAPQEGGLARAGGADDADHVPAAHGKINVPQHIVFPKALAQMPDLQNRLSAHLRVSPLLPR